MPETIDREFVTRVRSAVVEAHLVSAELWRQAVMESSSDLDARAADRRVEKLETILADAEASLEREARRAERARAAEAIGSLGPAILAALASGPAPSKRQIATAIGARVDMTGLAVRELVNRREIVTTPEGYALAPASRRAS